MAVTVVVVKARVLLLSPAGWSVFFDACVYPLRWFPLVPLFFLGVAPLGKRDEKGGGRRRIVVSIMSVNARVVG